MSNDKLPERVRRVIEECRGGQLLKKTYYNKTIGEVDIVFTFHPSDKNVATKSSEEAIGSGFLIPVGDGLFGPETSQTWRAP